MSCLLNICSAFLDGLFTNRDAKAWRFCTMTRRVEYDAARVL
jgi:hypothetical protein